MLSLVTVPSFLACVLLLYAVADYLCFRWQVARSVKRRNAGFHILRHASVFLITCDPVGFFQVLFDLVINRLFYRDYCEPFLWHLPIHPNKITFKAINTANKTCGKFQDKPKNVKPSKLCAVR